MAPLAHFGDRRLTWHKARRCFRKSYLDKVYYLRGDGSHQNTPANYESAVAEWMLRKAKIDNAERDAEVARKVRAAIEEVTQVTTEFRNGSNGTLGLPPLEPPRATTVPLRQSAQVYLDDLRGRAQRGEVSVGRYGKVHLQIHTFLNCVGPATDSNSVTEATLQEFRQAVTSRINGGKKHFSDYTALYLLQTVAHFVDWLYESRFLLERPRNIRTFKKIKVVKRPVRSFTIEQVKAIWAACENDRQRLFVALALNTAMNQADMARLMPQNLEPPFLVLQRRKTGVLACWKLWPVTQKLIETCKRRKLKKPTDLLFITRDGRPLVEGGFRNDGRTFYNDSVRQAFKRVLARANIRGMFVMLRKTVATVLKARGYGDVVQFFLAHENNALFLSNGVVSNGSSNGSVAETFYVGEQAKVEALKNHPRLLEAVDLLQQEFGLADGG